MRIKPKNNRTHKFALVSRLDKNKNVKQFFESLIPFIPSLKENDVLVVGDGPERKGLENFACKNNLQKIVKFVGFRKDANYFMASSECFVSLSLAEGQPNAVLEALALKKKRCCSLIYRPTKSWPILEILHLLTLIQGIAFRLD